MQPKDYNLVLQYKSIYRNDRNSVLNYLRGNLTAQRPITELAWVKREKQQQNSTNEIKA
jgi:hypothetical protein